MPVSKETPESQKDKTSNKNSSDDDRAADGWVAGIRVDAASVAALGDLDVTVGSPAGSPRVLHLEGVAVVAHCEDAVVKVGAASAGEDTAAVQLEGHLVSLDGHGHWAGLEGRLQRVGALANALVASDAATWDGSGVRRLARAIP